MPQKSFISILFSLAFNGLPAYFLTDEERTQTGFWDSPKSTEPVRDTAWLTPQVFFLLTQLFLFVCLFLKVVHHCPQHEKVNYILSWETSLVVQGLRLCTPNTGGPGLIPVGEMSSSPIIPGVYSLTGKHNIY